MIPNIIWQTYECDYNEIPPKALDCANSWQEKNPSWKYKYVSEKERADFVLKNFGEEWLKIYNSYTVNVLRASLWRYMCLYVHGGFYVDLDVFCKEPIDSWLNTSLDFAVSKEPNNPGLTQMIFASSQQNIFLENILKEIKRIYYFNKINKVEYKNVIDYSIYQTGYVTFSNSIFQTIMSNDVDNFIIYTGKDSEKIHFESTYNYRAGKAEKVFGPNYIAWQTEEYK
jgi:hypothetical protein